MFKTKILTYITLAQQKCLNYVFRVSKMASEPTLVDTRIKTWHVAPSYWHNAGLYRYIYVNNPGRVRLQGIGTFLKMRPLADINDPQLGTTWTPFFPADIVSR